MPRWWRHAPQGERGWPLGAQRSSWQPARGAAAAGPGRPAQQGQAKALSSRGRPPEDDGAAPGGSGSRRGSATAAADAASARPRPPRGHAGEARATSRERLARSPRGTRLAIACAVVAEGRVAEGAGISGLARMQRSFLTEEDGAALPRPSTAYYTRTRSEEVLPEKRSGARWWSRCCARLVWRAAESETTSCNQSTASGRVRP